MTHNSLLFTTTVLTTIALGAWAKSLHEDCTRDAEGSCVAPTSASLLQKVFTHDVKSAVTQEQPEWERRGDLQDKEDHFDLDTVCTGITAQGRCWYLSEQGESCDATCEKHGRSFSYVIADPDTPMVPRLVEHEPKVKQQPWAALECYVPSEDRYHTANQNAARHYVDNIGTWSHENCKLACPCGGHEVDRCNWIAPKECAPEFIWRGVRYNGCASVDLEHDRPWCQHHYQHTEKDDVHDWSYCTYSCEDELPKPKDKCVWSPAPGCVKEFDYEGAHYIGCTATDHDTPWCSNTDPYTGSWSHCSYSCEDKPELDDELCTWEAKPECAKTFDYKGVEYTGCIEQDHPTPWCSLHHVHRGEFETCTRVCRSARGSVAPVPDAPVPPVPERVNPVPRGPVPRTPEAPGEPCARRPDADDVIGSSVSLDEAGYTITAAAKSPVNMRRFVCRVVGDIGCRVTDSVPLDDIIPFYDGVKSTQTFKRLESELISTCHGGGKWIVPRPLP